MGGLAVGETQDQMFKTLEDTTYLCQKINQDI